MKLQKEVQYISFMSQNIFKNAITAFGIVLSSITLIGGTVGVSAQITLLRDIVDTASANGNFKSLVTAVDKAGLTSTLKGTGPFTVFAPTDAAFAKLPADTVNALLTDPAKKADLVNILTYHVVSGSVDASQVVKLTSAKTVQGQEVKISVRNGEVFLNDNVKVTMTDIKASNGIIHVIDTVLMPAPAMASTTATPAAPQMDIVDTASANGNFKSLVTAVDKAGLTSTLKGTGPFTVFAPTDAAFAKLPADTVNALLTDPAKKADLVNILTYHVVSGSVDASQVVKLTSAKTVQGQEVKISVRNGEVFLNDNVKVTMTDIKASNGIIHVIDTVLMPAPAMSMSEAQSVMTETVRTGGFDTLGLALVAMISIALSSLVFFSTKRTN